MEGAFGLEAVLAEEVSVVGGEHDEGVVGDAERLELVEDGADVLVHAADHAVVDGDVLGHLLFGVEVGRAAVHAASAGLLPVGEVGVLLLGLAEVLWVLVVLSGDELGHGDLCGVVHGVPGLGHEIGRVRIEEAGPEEEGLAIAGVVFHEGVGALGDPCVVVVLLGDAPGVFLGFGGVSVVLIPVVFVAEAFGPAVLVVALPVL